MHLERAFWKSTPAGWTGTHDVLSSHLFISPQQGSMTGVIGKDPVCLGAGEAAMIRAGSYRHFTVRQKVRSIRLRFTGKLPFAGRYRLISLSPTALAIAETLIQMDHRPDANHLTATHLLKALLEECRHLSLTPPSSRGLSLQQQAVLDLCIEEELERGLRVSDCARRLGFSSDHFARLFRAQYSLSPRAYIIKRRMQRAADLLKESTFNTTEVARSLGMKDVSLFCRQFRREFGCTPRQYRQGTHKDALKG